MTNKKSYQDYLKDIQVQGPQKNKTLYLKF